MGDVLLTITFLNFINYPIVFLMALLDFITNNYSYLAVTSQLKTNFILCFYFMQMVVLIACLSVHYHMYVVPVEVRREYQKLQDWKYRWF